MGFPKVIVYIDMDGVLADFDGAIGRDHERSPPEMYEKGFFRNLPLIPGAKNAVASLLANNALDVYIASKPVANEFCASEKVEWIAEHFPALTKKMFLICDKGHLNGHILIDDDKDAWSEVFDGEFFHFDVHNPEQAWKDIVDYMKEEYE